MAALRLAPGSRRSRRSGNSGAQPPRSRLLYKTAVRYAGERAGPRRPKHGGSRRRHATGPASRRRLSRSRTRSTGLRDDWSARVRRRRISCKRHMQGRSEAGSRSPRGRTSAPGSCASSRTSTSIAAARSSARRRRSRSRRGDYYLANKMASAAGEEALETDDVVERLSQDSIVNALVGDPAAVPRRRRTGRHRRLLVR